jgi:hypothetical protein
VIVPKQKHNARVYELAKVGAEAQLRDLLQEVRLLVDLFPHLRDSFDKDELPIKFLIAKGAGKAAGTRKPMSPAGRKAVSDRMKKYWAARRKASA